MNVTELKKLFETIPRNGRGKITDLNIVDELRYPLHFHQPFDNFVGRPQQINEKFQLLRNHLDLKNPEIIDKLLLWYTDYLGRAHNSGNMNINVLNKFEMLGVDLNTKTWTGKTAISIAAANDLNVLEQLLNKDSIDLSTIDEDCNSPLNYLLMANHKAPISETVRLLEKMLDKGANPNQEMKYHHFYPLYLAVTTNPSAIYSLLKYGANPDLVKDHLGRTIVDIARVSTTLDLLQDAIRKVEADDIVTLATNKSMAPEKSKRMHL